MRRLWPQSVAGQEVDDAELERIYAYPESLAAPWVQVNFVSSVDGAVTVDSRSAGLSGPADSRILALGRDLADVILVGAGTVHVEGYRGVEPAKTNTARRARLGLSEVPPIAVVTGQCSIEPTSPLVTDTEVAPIVLTTETAPEHRRNALSQAGVDVIVAGERTVEMRTALAALAERGLLRVDCEGGPTLFGSLIAEDVVDQLCLTVSPLLTGGHADRIANGPSPDAPRNLSLASVLTDDGFLMLRYRRG